MPYDRDDYRYSQAVEGAIVARDGLQSPYDLTTFRSTSESDIEHLIALSEAHDSGLCAASASVRRRFASDLDNLALATPELNRREKGARDAADWLPSKNRCWFAVQVVKVRREYGLTIDSREVRALEAVLSSCK